VTDVGSAPLRRLTRTEYERVVADVFGVTGSVSAGLAPDERIDGVFASNISSPVALVQVRQYLDAAESIASKVKLDALSSCDRAKLGDAACAKQLIETLGRRAYRRALDASEVDRYATLFAAESKAEGYEPGLRLVVQVMLQSPHLLYHFELGDPNQTIPNGVARLPGFALASRLSFFLWGSAPDDALLDAAASGVLDTDAGLLKEARRLLGDARAKNGVESFHTQWLGLLKLDTASRDQALYPEWTPELVTAIRDETASFADYVIREQTGDLPTLLGASYSFPTGPGLKLRGLTTAPPDGKVEMAASRAVGLLTQPAFLAAHAHNNQTSPILRGRALRERFFCQPLPDPPPDVAAVPPPLEPGLTTRERYAAHRTAGTACASCHSLIDDLGFALEHFDPIGRYRETEEGKPIDSTGVLRQTDVDGDMDGARALADKLSESEQVSRCYAKQWFRFAIGRSEADADSCALQRVEEAFARGGSIRDLLIAITSSDSFVRERREN
jgi:uncharacterized protein DUF1588/uncharacterized protein DUF1592/uncharacterized protein DUF1595/uncharacterized protein DUF1585/uncharacterized protein DUF1587